jgi:hypothetical protein
MQAREIEKSFELDIFSSVVFHLGLLERRAGCMRCVRLLPLLRLVLLLLLLCHHTLYGARDWAAAAAAIIA